jgi:hypothetical protein
MAQSFTARCLARRFTDGLAEGSAALVPFAFTGKLDKVTIELKGPPLSRELEEQIRQQQQKNGATQ